MPKKKKTETLPELKKAETKEDKLIRNLFIYPSKYQAGIQAGYSESYCKGPLYQRVKTEKFQRKIIDYAIANDILSLPKVAYIENKVLDHLMDNPLDSHKYKDVMRQKKQVSGLLQHDDAPQQPIVHIGSIRELSIQLQSKRMEQIDNIPEAEVISEKS